MNECVCVCIAAVLKLDDGTGVIECWKYINAGQELSLSLGDLVTACGVLYLLDRWEAWCMCTCMYVYMYVTMMVYLALATNVYMFYTSLIRLPK